MDSVRRVLAAVLTDAGGSGERETPASAPRATLAPRRLSTSFARASSPKVSELARKVLEVPLSAARAVGLKRTRVEPSSGRASPSIAGGETKRARGNSALDVSVTQRTIESGDVEGNDAPWPSSKRKRRSDAEDDASEARATHRRRMGGDAEETRFEASARVIERASDARATPTLAFGRVLRQGSVDAFKNLQKMPSRVTLRAMTRKPPRRGLSLRGPRRGLDARSAVEFSELPEDKAERERLEATKAPALVAPSTSSSFTFGASAQTATESKAASGTFTFGAVKSTTTDARALDKPSSGTTDSNVKPLTSATSAPAFSFGATPASAAATPNPFSAAAPPAAAPAANPFAGFTAAPPSTAAPGARRVVRARRPASRNR